MRSACTNRATNIVFAIWTTGQSEKIVNEDRTGRLNHYRAIHSRGLHHRLLILAISGRTRSTLECANSNWVLQWEGHVFVAETVRWAMRCRRVRSAEDAIGHLAVLSSRVHGLEASTGLMMASFDDLHSIAASDYFLAAASATHIETHRQLYTIDRQIIMFRTMKRLGYE